MNLDINQRILVASHVAKVQPYDTVTSNPIVSGDSDSALHLDPVHHLEGALPSKPVVFNHLLDEVPIGPTTGPTVVEMGDQWMKHADMSGLIMWIDVLVRKWTGYRPKASSYDLAMDKNGMHIELSIESFECVNAFMDKVQEQAQACGMEEATSDIVNNPRLCTQAIEIVRRKLVSGEEVEAIHKLLCDRIVKPNIKASATTQVQANQFWANLAEDFSNSQQQFVEKQQDWRAHKQKSIEVPAISADATPKADINLLKQAICSMAPGEKAARPTLLVENTYNRNYTIVPNDRLCEST